MNKPIILDYAIPRSTDGIKSFQYNYSEDMNVMVQEDSAVLFIDADKELCTTVTVTRVQREADDEEYRFLELEIKTEVDRERDDEEYSLSELESKTFTNRERDNEDDFNFN